MSLRFLFLLTAVLALVCAILAGVERSWFGPAREGIAARQEFDKLIAKNGWNGQIIPVHYDDEVRILMNDIDENELETIFPLLHRISWLRVIRIDESRLTEAGQIRWRNEFPNCILVVYTTE
jgi:hypothetical protein